MADIVTAIVDLARASAGIAALVGAHVYGDELPEAAVKQMPRGALVVKPSGGAAFQPASSANAEAQRIDLISFGATPLEADKLRRVAAPALLALRRHRQGDVLIHWVQPAGGYLTGRDPDGQWPYAFQSFQTLFSSMEVT